MRNIILEKSFTKCGQDDSARPFSKKSKLSISLDQQSEILYSLFILHAHRGGSRTAATSQMDGFQPFNIFTKSFPFGCCSSPRSAFGPCQDLLKYIKTKVQSILFYLISRISKKIDVWNQSPCLIFCLIFEEKYF